MATADLVTELNKDSFKLDADGEKKLTAAVLKLLEDNSNQVQELAVKCLGPLSKKVKEVHVQEIVDTLCNHLLSEKKGADELRDISSIGLKTVITEIPSENSPLPTLIVKQLTPRLVTGVSVNESKPEIVGYCLEVLNDLLSRFGALMTDDHDKILKVVQPQLSSKRATSRKRAIGCLGHLAVTIPDNLFTDLVNNLLKLIEQADKAETLRTNIQAIGAVARSVGFRLGKFLNKICPIILKYCDDAKLGNDDELRENCFQCFESLVQRCPKEISPFLPAITDLCLKYIKYDPNYTEEGEEMEVEEEEEEEEEEEGEGEEDYSDDDDMSWKVRRSAAKCLQAIISTRPELLQEMYAKVAPVLISRFREREENVKLDVFATFITLLKQTSLVLKRNPEITSLTDPLRELVPKVVQGITKQLKEKSVKTRIGAFSLLRELVSVLKGSLKSDVASLVPGIQLSLGDKNTHANLKIEALLFLRLLLATHDPSTLHPHLKVLAPPVFKAVRDNYYRISAEALRVCAEFVRTLRYEGSSFDYKPFVGDLFGATLDKLKVQDIDQEVKESAITCMGLIIATFGDQLKSELPAVLQIFLERLTNVTNEVTKITTVKSLESIAASKLRVDLTPILSESITVLTSFLRMANRQFKQSSLSALGVIVKNYGGEKKASDLFKTVISELAPLLNDSDLHLTHLALSLATSMIQVQSSSVPNVTKDLLPATLNIIKSSLLQGLALDSLLNFLSELVKSGGFDSLFNSLVGLVSGPDVPKQVLSNTAKAVAAITLSADTKAKETTVGKFIGDLSKAKDETARHLALYSLGEIGRRADLSSHDSLQKTILTAFDSPNEETRQAASFALGNVAVGNLHKYLPLVLAEIQGNAKIRYLLLHSLNEIIVRQSASSTGVDALRQYQKDLLPLLFNNCESEEEGTRNVVAECLGKLLIISPNELLPALLERVKSPSANTRSTIVTALKFAIVERPQPVDQLLLPQMATFLDCLKDQDLNVRRNTLLTLNYCAHNKPILIRDILPNYLPMVYAESKPKPELIREVDLGPFKHKVDDGLEIRKAAFETMYTLLDTCLDRVSVGAFVSNLVDGLKDHYDIKMLAHLMLIRLSALSGGALLEGLDQLVEPMRETVTSKPKEGAVKQDMERNDELIRSCLRAIYGITRIPNVESNHKFDEFLRQVIKTGELAEKFAAVKSEGEQYEGGSDPMDVSK